MRIKPVLKALINNIFPIFDIGTASIQKHPKSKLTFEVEPQECEDVPPSFQANQGLGSFCIIFELKKYCQRKPCILWFTDWITPTTYLQ